jgi:CubicO group peptidase (beta-lactamase class C family)
MNYRVQRTMLSVVLLVFLFTLTFSPVRAQSIIPAEAGPFLDELVLAQMQEHNLPNAAIALVANGEVIHLNGYGFADLERQIPVDAAETLFRTGSVAKLFTWTAVMQLVERGELELDVDINRYLHFEIPSRLLHTSEPPAPITLAHLMTHTAGFEAYPDQIFRLSAEQYLPLEEYVQVHMPERVFYPGTVPAYSNYSAALAGYIVQRISGQPFAEYVEQNIFAPLAMQNSTFRQPPAEHLSQNLARPYRSIQGVYHQGEFEFMQEPEGSLSSTAADMARYMLTHLGGGQLDGNYILEEATIERMHTRQTTLHPAVGGMALGFMEGTFNDQRVLFHGGSTMMYDSGLYLLPNEGVGLYMVYSGGSHLIHSAVFQGFLDRYFPGSKNTRSGQSTAAAGNARQFTGEYQQNTRSFTTSEAITSLFMGVIQVTSDDEGYLVVTHNGETNRFVETEPGIYQNLREGRSQDYFGPFQTIVFSGDPFGRMMLVSDGPMTYSRPAWYASAAFTVPALVLILLLALISLVVWSVGYLVTTIRRRTTPSDWTSRLARLTGLVLALLIFLFLLGVLLTGADDPLYNLPPAAFGVQPDWAPVHAFLPVVIAVFAVLAVIFAGLSWIRSFWQAAGRIHYTLFTFSSLVLLFILWYWNAL